MKRTPAGYLYALGATAIWSGNFIIARGFSTRVPPVSLAFWRWFTAVAVLAPFALPALVRHFPLVRRNLPYLAAVGFLGVTVFNTLVYIASHTTTAMNMSLISITFPVIIIVLSRFLYGERISPARAGGMVMVLCGVVLLVTRGDISILLRLSFSTGDIWMMLASTAFALYSILLRHKPADMEHRVLQLSSFVIGLLLLLPAYLLERASVPAPAADLPFIMAVLYAGVCASLIAYQLWNRAVGTIGPSEAGLVYYTLPLFSGVLSLLFLGEAVTPVHLVSSLLIIGGIVAANHVRTARGSAR